MEIQVGEYIRSEYGEIAKVLGDDGNRITGYDGNIYFKEDIVKHSFNIIDLIEIGDYVNGYKVDNIIDGVLVHRANGIDRSGFLVPIAQYNDDIKTIVTKEQFKAAEYEV